MSARLLASFLKTRGLMLNSTRKYKPRPITRAINPVPRYLNHNHVRYLTVEPDSPTEPELDFTPPIPTEITATIVSELQKANVRCTAIGLWEFEYTYGNEKTYEQVFGDNDPYHLYEPLMTARNPTSLSHLDVTTSGEKWRSEYVHDAWISSKVYKLREALYKHSPVFRGMIDYEEEAFENFYTRPRGVEDTYFWIWLERVIKHGLVEREDVEALPEIMFRDVVVGSGVKEEKLGEKLEDSAGSF
ncbi:hypothetical protein TWF481_006881 [Arthrobotrys musiformis]|uniref:Uncharacterized protein n=1 Tax=Arthrobotrys musiformis TaxID=47236 RepID=A0AAV9WBG5_9PEZI